MSKKQFLTVELTQRQKLWGLRYLLFQTVFLSSVLISANNLLPVALDVSVLNFIFFSINFAAVLIIFRNFLAQFLRLDWAGVGRIVLWGLVFFGLYWLCINTLGHVFAQIDPTFFNLNDLSIADMSRENYPLILIGTVFMVPVTEECLHRGLVFRGLYERSAILAFIVSAAVFSMIHVVGYIGQISLLTFLLSFLQYIPAGLCLAAAYRLSGSLLCPILIHAAINAVGMLALR